MTEALISMTVADILDERGRQDKKWGGPKHDDKHDSQEWENILDRLWGEVHSLPLNNDDDVREVRRRLVQFAAVAVAMVESFDRVVLGQK